MAMKRISIILFFIILLLFLGWRFLWRGAESGDVEKVPKAIAVAVEASPVRTGNIHDVKVFTGTLMPRAHFIVAPKIGGRLKSLLVNIGDRISHGQLIALLDDAEYVQQVNEYQAELKVARATLEEQNSALESSQREFDRVSTLREKGIASESELDFVRSQLEVKTAKQKVAIAQVSQKEAALEAAKVRLSYTRITASWEDGSDLRVVGERFVDEGAMLTSNSPIVSIYDINSLTAVIFVIERDYPRINVGQEALVFTDAYGDRTFFGRIIRLSPVLKETSRQARVEIEIPNSDWLLKPGMFARVEIEFAMHENVTLLPVAAFAQRGDRQGVFLVDTEAMKARFIPVELGIVNGESAEVVSPRISGLVVTLGHHLLEDGAPITLPDDNQK